MNNGQIFFSEIKAYFNLRKPKGDKSTNIYLVVRMSDVQEKYVTGVKVYPIRRNMVKQEAILNHRLTELDLYNNVIVNNRLDELRLRFLDFKCYIGTNLLWIKEEYEVFIRHLLIRVNMKIIY